MTRKSWPTANPKTSSMCKGKGTSNQKSQGEEAPVLTFFLIFEIQKCFSNLAIIIEKRRDQYMKYLQGCFINYIGCTAVCGESAWSLPRGIFSVYGSKLGEVLAHDIFLAPNM
jgi:hypothetical protein